MPDTASRFDSLTVGYCLPELIRGPLREPHLMRWSGAIENWHRIHYDQQFATEHDGLPGLLINGSWKQHFLVQMVREWAEPAGWLYQIEFQFRSMDIVGDTLAAWGRIVRLTEHGDCGLADLEIGIRNVSRQRPSTRGTATVVLPLRDGPAVPYPFPFALARSIEEGSHDDTRNDPLAG